MIVLPLLVAGALMLPATQAAAAPSQVATR